MTKAKQLSIDLSSTSKPRMVNM